MATKTQEKQTSDVKDKSADALQAVQENVKPFRAFMTKFGNDWSMNLSAALAYNLLMAIFPILIAILAILGIVLGTLNAGALNSLTAQIQQIFPQSTGSLIVGSARSQLSKASGILSVIAIVLAIFNGSRLFILIEGCFDIIYHVRQRKVIPQNLMALGMLLLFIILIPLMVLAATLPTLAYSVLKNTPLGQIPGISTIFGILSGVIAAYIFFQSIYIVVPNQKVSWRNSWRGALVGAVLLQLYLTLFPLYVQHFLSSGAAAAVGSAVILLVFFYYFAVILFLGAEVNAFFAEGITSTPENLVTMVHIMSSHMPTTDKAMREQAAVDHKGETPKEIQPKGKLFGRKSSGTSNVQDQSGQDKSNKKSKGQKSTSGSSRTNTIIEIAAGTVLTFVIEFFRLRRK